jgi:DNA-binding response OmpR family regulator
VRSSCRVGEISPKPAPVIWTLEGSAARPEPASQAGRRTSADHLPPEARVELILLTSAVQSTTEVLPALGLLPHQVTVLPQDASALVDRGLGDAVLVDARRDLMNARAFLRLLTAIGVTVPVLAVLTEGGLIAISGEWAVDDVVLDTAGPAELDARLRLAVERYAAQSEDVSGRLEIGELTIDETTYSARLSGNALDLTYKEFELLKFLAQHPGRVFTRAQLLQEVWGYDYFGGTRTVDVHVRRLRAKLGAEHEALIGTVRNVGYKFVRPAEGGRREEPEQGRPPGGRRAAESLEAPR